MTVIITKSHFSGRSRSATIVEGVDAIQNLLRNGKAGRASSAALAGERFSALLVVDSGVLYASCTSRILPRFLPPPTSQIALLRYSMPLLALLLPPVSHEPCVRTDPFKRTMTIGSGLRQLKLICLPKRHVGEPWGTGVSVQNLTNCSENQGQYTGPVCILPNTGIRW